MTGTQAGYLLLLLAMVAGLARAYEVGLLLAIVAGLVGLLGQTSEQRDARFRNHARRVR